MPEGDTIHKLATAIAPRLEGRRLARFELRGDATLDLRGRRVERVAARGKHLWIDVEGDLALRTHLGMHGSWHRYATGEAWRRPRRQAALVLATEDDVFVCFNASEAECVRAGGARAGRAERRVGPDLVAETDPDLEEVVRRARVILDGDTPMTDALLHQGVAAGIGNVYKAELLFLFGLHPLRRLDSVDDVTLEALYREARGLLRKNLGGGRRVTRFERDGAGRQWVYGRAGEPCLRCGATIERDMLGGRRRVTDWCPRCQRET